MADHDGRGSVEHERTYAVPDDAVVPFGPEPEGVARVSQVRRLRLHAGYRDTEALDLLRHGVTLRRRTGGHDEGWHLKVPLGPDRKREITHPLGADDEDVPAELLDQVLALTRDRPLRPVATVTTDREETVLVDAGGRELGVLCDDRVAAGSALADGQATVWREWEVELAPGRGADDLDALEQVVLATGARRSDQPSKLARALRRPAPSAGPRRRGRTAGEQVAARLAELYADLVRYDAAVRTGHGDGVHQMRIAARRTRAALRTVRPLLEPGATDRLRAELRLLGQVLGPARDAEVLEQRLVSALAAEPSELVLGPVHARLVHELHRDRDRAAVRVRSALTTQRYWRLLDDLEAFVGALPLGPAAGRPAAPVLADLVRRDSRGVRRAVRVARRATGRQHDEALHEVRKKAKALRYTAELATPSGGKGARRLAARAKAVQQALGEHQDATVSADVLRRLGAAAYLAGENGFTFGVLLGTERLRAREAEERGDEALRRLPSPKGAARWVRR